MKQLGKSGAAIAISAFALVATGVALTQVSTAAEGKVQCIGVNACKGHSECQTANSGCTGMNACKGKGWISKTKAECQALEGTVGDPV